MTGKANAVFWIGFILIFMNFWISGQSTVLWQAISGGGVKTGGPNGPQPMILQKGQRAPKGWTKVGNMVFPPGYVTPPAKSN